MNGTGFRVAIFAAIAVMWAAPQALAQSSEIEQMRREYDQQLRVMQQAFEERMSALEDKMEGSGNDLQWYWKEGLRFDSANGDFKFKLSGRIQWDSAFFDQDSSSENGLNGEFEDSTEFRRSRLAISGTIYKDFGFKAQYDFVEDGDSEFKDVYIDYKKVPFLGTIRAGHFKEPFSLDELTSSKDITFMERGFPNDFAPGRNNGIMVTNTFYDDRIQAAVGIFRDADGDGDSFYDGGYSWTGRVTGRPWIAEEGDKYIHLGASASLREDTEIAAGFGTDGEVHLAPTFLSTGAPVIDDAFQYGLEAAVVYGPFHAQAEYIGVTLDQKGTGMSDLDYDGWYAQAGYFITGEHRRYKASSGAFDKVKPKENFQMSGDGGLGAWEVAARYSMIDLEDTNNATGNGEQGEGEAFTLGVNWYLNPNMRIALNWVHNELEYRFAPDEDFDAVQTRFQVTW